jgi:hypothetical protein
MFYLAIGRLRWIMWTQLAIGLLNVALGLAGGALAGPLGVAGGGMLALAIGSLPVMAALHFEYRVNPKELLPSSSGALVTVCAIGLAWTGYATLSWEGLDQAVRWFGWGALFTAGLSAVLVWHHPSARDLLSRILTRTSIAPHP